MSTTSVKNLKKCCIVKNCKFYLGTTEKIHMFRYLKYSGVLFFEYFASYLSSFNFIIFQRMPQDLNLQKEWKIALGFDPNKIIKGLVCKEHFGPNNITGNPERLKKMQFH